ncbi:PAS domain S-box protein [Actinomadura sp. ATCC 31491]|uniref:histidine kinase n=1 Tax=Actinomadura luzonensis TaxID=2805427 RepID=A0ABT0G3F6_9ACTN|nr:PAS domain S-box protein [Actinomadura luzonensis]MCK2219137.1 PAS domain S-box protein [Actinomadura luzonensis]
MPERDRTAEDLRLLVQSIRDCAILMLDPQGRIVSWNTGAQRIKGYAAEEVIGRHFSLSHPPEDVAAGTPAMELAAAAADGQWAAEGWRVRKDGTRFRAAVVLTALRDEHGGLRGFGEVTRDVTGQRAPALDERATLLARLVEAQERERRRIANDVHGDTIQAMVAVGMRLRMLEPRLPREHAEAVRGIDDAVNGAVERLRELAFRLRPPVEGLVAGLAAYMETAMAGTGLTYELAHDLDAEPPAEAATTVFRICQEALTNVARHAGAASVTVSVVSLDRGVHVRVHDDGVGLARPAAGPARQPAALGHFGLIEMRERAETAGGWWDIQGDQGTGTTVEFWVPAVPRRLS